MEVILYKIVLICMSKVFIIHSQEASGPKGLGESACTYFASTNPDCNHKTVTVDKLPEACTSFVVDGFKVNDSSYKIYPRLSESDKNELDNTLKVGKNVYVVYGRKTCAEWSIFLDNMDCDDTNAVEESKSINLFLEKHQGVTGFLLYGMEPDEDSIGVILKTENVLKYIETLKRETKLDIGFSFSSYLFFDHCQNTPTMPWLDFSVLKNCVDIFFFSMGEFYNSCTRDMKYGVYPIDGTATYTLEKFKSCVKSHKIPTEKTYYNSVVVPRTLDNNDDCVEKSELLCTSPDVSKDWCADTLENLYKKGQWYKQNGAGFVGLDLNFDDPIGCCDCGPYPGFNAILAGYNGAPTEPICPLYDRQV